MCEQYKLVKRVTFSFTVTMDGLMCEQYKLVKRVTFSFTVTMDGLTDNSSFTAAFQDLQQNISDNIYHTHWVFVYSLYDPHTAQLTIVRRYSAHIKPRKIIKNH